MCFAMSSSKCCWTASPSQRRKEGGNISAGPRWAWEGEEASTGSLPRAGMQEWRRKEAGERGDWDGPGEGSEEFKTSGTGRRRKC